MATLIKNHNRFYLQFYDADRRPARKRVALKTPDKRHAVKLQRRLEAAYLDNRFDPWRDDPRTLERLDAAPLTLADTLARFIERKEATGRATNTLRAYRDAVGLWASRVGPDTPLKALTAADVEAFIRDGSVSPTTQAFRFRHVRAVLRWAAREGLTSRDLCAEVEPPRKADRPPKAITEAELDHICEGLEAIYGERRASNLCRRGDVVWRVPMLRFAFYTGLRSSELARLRWRDIDEAERLIRIHRQKNRKTQTVPLTRKAADVLNALPKREPEDYVFASPRSDERERDTRAFVNNTARAFRAARERAKIGRRVTVHSTRHGFCSALAAAGKSAVVIKEAARHADVNTSMIYVTLANDTLKTELDSVFG